jgi:hypothetical protein
VVGEAIGWAGEQLGAEVELAEVAVGHFRGRTRLLALRCPQRLQRQPGG